MDAPEEDADIKLQKISSDLIADFDRSLQSFLRRPDGTVRGQVRSHEAARLATSLLDPFQELPQLLDPHLSRWVPALGNALVDYLAAPRRSRTRSIRAGLLMPLPAAICKLLYTLCKIRGEKVVVRFLSVETRHLERLLSALEDSERSAANAAAAASAAPSDDAAASQQDESAACIWTWEERYVVLLWLSHLFLAPFDLATISSVDLAEDDLPDIPGLQWPPNIPGITLRILPLALEYLGSPGKERDAARALLVRIAMRRDMQELGILNALVQWSLDALRPRGKGAGDDNGVYDAATGTHSSPYHYIGVLSFLAGMLASSSNTSDMDRYLTAVFYAAYNISSGRDAAPTSKLIASSALARKTMIKVMRSVAVLVLRKPLEESGGGPRRAETILVETAVGHLLDLLSDNDTPVRLAASKALSVIALKLQPDLAAQVVDAVLEALDRNVHWVKPATSASPGLAVSPDTSALRTRDLSSVDPLEWHGLMLSLSHLLYRRSPPAASLASIVRALIVGLSFERRGPSGTSIGTNVRDASCFGIWALARRYTTPELLAVNTGIFDAVPSGGSGSNSSPSAATSTPTSVLQILATELTVAASLDPSGNIRRGASAALQELVGRHPDTVEQGIWLVQAVDYHAVALRSRAASQVAVQAAHLSGARYGEAVLNALLGWRGIGDGDAAARRVAGSTFSAVVHELATAITPEATSTAAPSAPTTAADHDFGSGDGRLSRLTSAFETLFQSLRGLETRQVEERHGLLLCLAAVLDAVPELAGPISGRASPSGEPAAALTPITPDHLMHLVNTMVMPGLTRVLESCLATPFRHPELIAEAGSILITSSFPILQAATLGHCLESKLLPGAHIVSSTSNQASLPSLLTALDQAGANSRCGQAFGELLAVSQRAVDGWLARTEGEVVAAASAASLVLLVFCENENENENENSGAVKSRRQLVGQWARLLRQNPTTTRSGVGTGYFFAVAMAYPVVSHLETVAAAAASLEDGGTDGRALRRQLICKPILDRWSSDRKTDTRVAILKSLTGSDVLRENMADLLGLVTEGLDDYTTTARGDVGSHVRLQAIKATRALWDTMLTAPGAADRSDYDAVDTAVSALFLRILRLAAEKLDKVRAEAQMTLALTLNTRVASDLRKSTYSSRKYYRFLLNLLTAADDHMLPIVSGTARRDPGRWMEELMAGYVTSADAGHEELVIAGRAALSAYCALSRANLDRACGALVRNLKRYSSASSSSPPHPAPTSARPGQGQQQQQQHDRIVVPTLSIVAFLFNAGLFQRCSVVDYKALCLSVQRCGYKTGNVRKLEACVRVYGAIAGMQQQQQQQQQQLGRQCRPGEPEPELGESEAEEDGEDQGRGRQDQELALPRPEQKKEEGVKEARRRLGALMLHPWPRVRTVVVDELWVLLSAESAGPAEKLKGVDWGTADKAEIGMLVGQLGLA
ncbi:hypothetical protein RB595_005858 [Gaeumannomyces hyphopodioides]